MNPSGTAELFERARREQARTRRLHAELSREFVRAMVNLRDSRPRQGDGAPAAERNRETAVRPPGA